jgi:cobalt-precorrin 5A hydrolase/precorrin-3B C17-methyltransferase
LTPRLGLAPDELPAGWRIGNPDMAKPVMAALLAGEAVRLDGEVPFLAGVKTDPSARYGIKAGIHEAAPADTLRLHPAKLTLGVGCARGAEPAEVSDLVARVLAEHGLARESVAWVASIDLKEDEPALHALGLPARFFPAARLEAETPRLANPSEIVFAAVGCHGVAESAALAAAGPGGCLLVPKVKSARATCAVGLSDAIIDPLAVGEARGSLA